MLMAALRLNIPVVFVSGGPMEAGKTKLANHGLDLVDAMVVAADDSCSDEKVAEYERSACPTCGSCSGMFTANSMNCLTEALGLSLPGNGTTLATHADREQLFLRAGRIAVELCKRYYQDGDESVLPRNVASRKAFENAMTLDIAMGGSTNTILHLLAAAQEAEVDFDLRDIDALSRKVPQLCKVAPNIQKYHMEDVHRAGGIFSILGELARGGLLHTDVSTCTARAWPMPSPNGTSPRPRTKRYIPSSRPARRASRPRSPSARPPAGRAWTWTVPKAASAASSTPIPRKAASPCSTATSPWTAAW